MNKILPLFFVVGCSFSEPLEVKIEANSSTYSYDDYDYCMEFVFDSTYDNPESFVNRKYFLEQIHMENNCGLYFSQMYECDWKEIYESPMTRADVTGAIVLYLGYNNSISPYWNSHSPLCDFENPVYLDVSPDHDTFYEDIQLAFCSDGLIEPKGSYFCPNYMASKSWTLATIAKANKTISEN